MVIVVMKEQVGLGEWNEKSVKERMIRMRLTE